MIMTIMMMMNWKRVVVDFAVAVFVLTVNVTQDERMVVVWTWIMN